MDTRKLCLDCTNTKAEYICRTCLHCEACCRCERRGDYAPRLAIEGMLLREKRERKARVPS